EGAGEKYADIKIQTKMRNDIDNLIDKASRKEISRETFEEQKDIALKNYRTIFGEGYLPPLTEETVTKLEAIYGQEEIAILREILEAPQEKVDITNIDKVKELNEALKIFGYDGIEEVLKTFGNEKNFVKATFDKKTGVLTVEFKEMSVDDDVKTLSSIMVKEERKKITDYLEAFEKSGINKFTDGKFNVEIESTRSGIKIKGINWKLDLKKINEDNIDQFGEAYNSYAKMLGLKELDKKALEELKRLIEGYQKEGIDNLEVKYDFENQELTIGNVLVGKQRVENVVKNIGENAQKIINTVLKTFEEIGENVDEREFFVGMVTNRKGSKTIITPIFDAKTEREIASKFVQKYASKINLRVNVEILQFATGISIDLANGEPLGTFNMENIKDNINYIEKTLGPQGMEKFLKTFLNMLQEQGLIDRGIKLNELTLEEIKELFLFDENEILKHITGIEFNIPLEKGTEEKPSGIDFKDMKIDSIRIGIDGFSKIGGRYGGDEGKLQKVGNELKEKLGVESVEIKFDGETGRIYIPMFKPSEVPKLKGTLLQ
ncbi:MAG: hypothetical protein OEY25_16080, partial [Candidatus Aminicenantes bacterium]|nr:hypothetical protein [Candidatus Aminicenantes bacterium]